MKNAGVGLRRYALDESYLTEPLRQNMQMVLICWLSHDLYYTIQSSGMH